MLNHNPTLKLESEEESICKGSKKKEVIKIRKEIWEIEDRKTIDKKINKNTNCFAEKRKELTNTLIYR